MPELDYPSGPWTGFYNYGSGLGPHPMDLFLNFSGGRVFGDGLDEVGQFSISGGFDDDGQCRWTKTYPRSHDVFYTGFREGKGIWGTWEIANYGRGGFHIWPVGSDGVGEEVTESTEQEMPVEIVTPLLTITRTASHTH